MNKINLILSLIALFIFSYAIGKAYDGGRFTFISHLTDPSESTVTPISLKDIPDNDSNFIISPTPIARGNAIKDTQIDPIVNCQFPYSGIISMPQSKCDKMTDCEISPGKWSAVYLKDCNELFTNQAKEAAKTAEKVTPEISPVALPSLNPWPTYSPPPFKTSCYVGGIYYYVTLEECTEKTKVHVQELQKKNEAQAAQQAQMDELKRKHQQACDAAVSEWYDKKQQFLATSNNQFSSSAEQQIALFQLRAEYQQDLNDAGCSNKIH